MAQRIITHSGPFHADDVTAVAILERVNALRPQGEFSHIRSRDMKIIQPGDLVVDVGGKNGVFPIEGGEVTYFDHHQPGGAGARDNGIPYASAGLVWRSFGADLVRYLYVKASDEEVARIFSLVDRDFIQGIDAADCGYDLAESWKGDARPLTFSQVVSSLNPAWYEEPEFDRRFQEAVDYAITALMHSIRRAFGTVLAESRVWEALAARTDRRILELPQFCPWGDAVFGTSEANDVLYVVFPQSGGGQWNVQCVPDKPGSFGRRKALPAAWAGLRDDELKVASGVADAVFCHRGLFIGGAVSREGALRMAKLAADGCPSCGSAQCDDSHFCDQCGQPLKVAGIS